MKRGGPAEQWGGEVCVREVNGLVASRVRLSKPRCHEQEGTAPSCDKSGRSKNNRAEGLYRACLLCSPQSTTGLCL